MKKILIWHQGALGDLILSLPAVRAIKEHAGGGSLHLVCRSDMADVILESNLADEVTSNEKGMFGFLFGVPEHHPPDLQSFLDGFDAAFVFMRDSHESFIYNLRQYIIRCCHIKTFPLEGVRTHVAHYQLRQLAEFGIEHGDAIPVLDEDCGPLSSSEIPVVAIHPGSGGKKKCWPLQRYLQLMEELQGEEELSFLVILGPAEEGGEYEIIAEFLSQRKIPAGIIRDTTVSGIFRKLKGADLFIGNDSGITHLASAGGVPVVAIFGPTDHEVWKPLGRNVRVVHSGRPCSPCRGEDYRRCSGVECLESVEVKAVLKECRKALRMI